MTMLITPDYMRFMARYNKWQNESLTGAADTLTDEARNADRGSFFKSITATLNHLLWADTIWLSRLAGGTPPSGRNIPESLVETSDWADYKARRAAIDEQITAWAAGMTAEKLAEDATFTSAALGKEVTRPMAPLVMHVFNHATHHRGQVHAMLTAAGAKPDDTDLFLMSDSV